MDQDQKAKNVAKRANRILDIAMEMAKGLGCHVQNRIEEIQLHYDGYAEPGYSALYDVVATGNWNDIDEYDYQTKTRKHISNLPSRISHMFESMGIECEWNDQWDTCCDCGKLVRTDADCYSWTRSYQYLDGEGCRCIECLEEDPESYLESLEGNSDTANTIDSIDPCKHGYIKFNEDSYESGWYPGQNDSPHKVAKDLEAKGIYKYLFGIDSVGQFDTHWSVYVHQDEEHLLNPPEEDSEDEEEQEDDVNEAAGSDHDMPLAAVEVEKKHCPCKFCKTDLYEGETPCWKCGTDNPTM
jgi:hypothetical protein